MRAWWELYKKEIYSLSFLAMVVVLLISVWNIFLFFKIDVWPEGLSFGLSFLPLSFLPLLALWLAYHSYQQEWKDDTNYFILSIPRSGWEIGLSKAVSFMTFYIAASLVSVILILFFHQGLIRELLVEIQDLSINTGVLYRIIIKILFAYWITALGIYIKVQFSQIVSLFYDRFRGLITIIVFLITNYGLLRLTTLLSRLFRWCPDILLENFNISNPFTENINIRISSGPIIVTLLLHVALFFLGSWIVEKHLEV